MTGKEVLFKTLRHEETERPAWVPMAGFLHPANFSKPFKSDCSSPARSFSSAVPSSAAKPCGPTIALKKSFPRGLPMRILLVEDDPMIADAVKSALADEAHAVDHVSSGRTALTQLGLSDYQLVLLDLGLPGLDGMSVLRTLRGEGSAKNDIPVIILTARDALEDRLNGLDAGADDYLVKPFHMSELLARMRAVMRRRNGAAANVLSNGDLSLSEAAKTVERAGQTYTLTKREYALLSALLARPGAILSRRALEDRIYAVGEEPDSNAVEYLIHALRKKLGADAVKNVRGLGWMVAGRDAKPE